MTKVTGIQLYKRIHFLMAAIKDLEESKRLANFGPGGEWYKNRIDECNNKLTELNRELEYWSSAKFVKE